MGLWHRPTLSELPEFSKAQTFLLCPLASAPENPTIVVLPHLCWESPDWRFDSLITAIESYCRIVEIPRILKVYLLFDLVWRRYCMLFLWHLGFEMDKYRSGLLDLYHLWRCSNIGVYTTCSYTSRKCSDYMNYTRILVQASASALLKNHRELPYWLKACVISLSGFTRCPTGVRVQRATMISRSNQKSTPPDSAQHLSIHHRFLHDSVR